MQRPDGVFLSKKICIQGRSTEARILWDMSPTGNTSRPSRAVWKNDRCAPPGPRESGTSGRESDSRGPERRDPREMPPGDDDEVAVFFVEMDLDELRADGSTS